MSDPGHMQGGKPIVPERFTREEWLEKMRLEECARFGHDFSFTTTGSGEPVAVGCDRCGRKWGIVDT